MPKAQPNTPDDSTPVEKAKRTTLDAKTKAQNALDVAQRKVDACQKKRDAAYESIREADAQMAPLAAERDYLANHPALADPVEAESHPDPEPEPEPEPSPEPDAPLDLS